MSLANPCHDQIAGASGTRSASRLAGLLRWAGDYLEQRALRRERFRQLRHSKRQLQRLDDRTLYDVGLTRGQVDTLVRGLVTPSDLSLGPYDRR